MRRKKTSLESTKGLKGQAEKKLLETIKGDYAARERDFRPDLINKPRVNIDTLYTIYQKKDASAAYSSTALAKEIEEGTKTIIGTTNAQKVYWTAPNSTVPDTIQVCSNLLTKKVQQVELDERDKYLITILSETERLNYIHSAQRNIIDTKAEICPLCQQPLSIQTREDLEAKIKHILNKDVENYQAELLNSITSLTDISIQAPIFPVDTYNADINAYNNAVAGVNKVLDEIRARLKAKTSNLFNGEQPLDINSINQYFSVLADACKKLQEDVNAFNQSIDDKKALENELKKKNQMLAYLENQVLFDKYYKAITIIEQAEKTIRDLEEQLKSIKGQLKDIESQRSQTKIAIDFINRSLSSIFFDRDRLSLEDAGGKFKVKSRGTAVAPDSVSTGERNIIGLAYFFATLYENTSNTNRYQQPYLVVIDDPISSFDHDNRLGVMTFLKEKLTDLLVNNKDSKVLIMSHDQRTIDLLVSINSSVENYIRHNNQQKGHEDYFIYELHRRERRQTNIKTKNEYSQMLNLLYQFAQEEDPNKVEYVGIGNTIRRVLETFSLMITNNADYVRMMDNNRLHLYTPIKCDITSLKRAYSRMLTRIVLNPESHSAMQIDQNSYESTFSRENLQVLAQYTLTFIMCVNEQHLWSCFEKGWKDKVNDWLYKLIYLECQA